jgi:DNA-directed RNA polymerase specialized sigma24 family protein
MGDRSSPRLWRDEPANGRGLSPGRGVLTLKRPSPERDRSSSPGVASPGGGPPALPDERPTIDACRADAHLVARCLAGEVAAWEELYAQCHPRLLVFVRQRLGSGRRDPNLVDEIAARVWYALVADDGKLLERYDPERGARLITFLRTLAKGIVSGYFRSENRRRKRELLVLTGKSQDYAMDTAESDALLSEFRATLTSRESDFMGKQLLAETSDDTAAAKEQQREPLSRAASWQSTHRIYRKLLTFLGG